MQGRAKCTTPIFAELTFRILYSNCTTFIGAVLRDSLLPQPHLMAAGDTLIGLRSSGIHSNGYSLVRQCITTAGLTLHSAPSFESPYATLGEALLVPTYIYVQTLLPLLKEGGLVKGLAHITGGGLINNIPRVLPPHLVAVLHAHKDNNITDTSATTTTTEVTKPAKEAAATPASTTTTTKGTTTKDTTPYTPSTDQWTLPPVFAWLQHTAQLSQDDLLSTFNCGIGMILVVATDQVKEVMHRLQGCTEGAFIVGQLRDRAQQTSREGEEGEEGGEGTQVYLEPQVEVLGDLL